MRVPANDRPDADKGAPTILGQAHELLAEVATRAAREAADEHVRAGRLTPERQDGQPGGTHPVDGGLP